MGALFSSSVLAASFRIATPLLLAALGVLICGKAGMNNLAVEGFMLMGSFIAIAYVQLAQGSVWMAMLAAIVGTGIFSLLFGIMSLKFKANEIVLSISLNMLSVGLTSFFLRSLLGAQGMIRPANLVKIPNMQFPFLSKVPILNAIFCNQSFIVPLTIALAFITAFILKKSRYGLNICSIGESYDAAVTSGLKVNSIKLSAVIISGIVCGLAGAYLSTTILSEFSENMVAGRGFTAYTAVIFGAYNPILVWLVCLFFGWAEAVGVQIELAGLGIPAPIVQMFPYASAIFALLISSIIVKKRNNNS